MPKDRLPFPLLVGAGLLAAGCGGYTSEYVPPPDGRPRLVWQDNKVVPMMSNPVPGECSLAVDTISGGDVGGRVRGRVRGGYYAPVRTVAIVHVSGPPIVPVPRPIFVPVGGSGGGGLGKLGGGGGGGGSGDLGKGAIVIAAVAVAVLPFIALGLAAGRPEPESEVAAAIDRVNAHTDLARSEGSPCDELIVAGEVAQ